MEDSIIDLKNGGVEDIKTYICNRCDTEYPTYMFYGRNKVCKKCYNERKRKPEKEKIWRCKYCGTTRIESRHYNYAFCKECAKKDRRGDWKCKDCGTADIDKRQVNSTRCKECYNAYYRNKRKGEIK